MKKVLVSLLLLVCICSYANAQKEAKEKELSNAEQFALKSGALIQREFSEVGKLRTAEFQIMSITDLLSGSKTQGLKIEMSITKSYGTTEKSAVLDADEVDGFLKSMKYLQEKVLGTTPAVYTEVEYKARGGFKGGCYSDEKKGWSFFIKLDKYDSDSYLFLKKEELPILIKLFEDAKGKFL